MTNTKAKRLDFLLRAKPKVSADSTEMFEISDNFTLYIISRVNYFDIIFRFHNIELDCWIYLKRSTNEIVCHDTKHRVGRGHFISDIMDKYPEIFEWVLWHPEIFEPPEVTSDE
mgnify:CR=1 FL=1